MSAIRHPTEKILEFIDLNLRPHVEKLPSYLKDTKKIPFSGLTEEILLITMYVTSLYTNIPHQEGIEACRETRTIAKLFTEFLAQLLEHVF